MRESAQSAAVYSRQIWVIGAGGGGDSPVLTAKSIYANPMIVP